MHAGRQRGGQHRAHDEGHLVEGRLQRIGGVQVVGVVGGVVPAGAHQGPGGSARRARHDGRGEQRPRGQLQHGEDHQQGQRRCSHNDRGVHHPALAVAIYQVRQRCGAQGPGHRGRGRERSGQAVAAVEGRHHQHHAQAHHRPAGTSQQAGGAELPGTGKAQNLPVGAHSLILSQPVVSCRIVMPSLLNSSSRRTPGSLVAFVAAQWGAPRPALGDAGCAAESPGTQRAERRARWGVPPA